MNPLEQRKLHLIAESELNRDRLLQAGQKVAAEISVLAERARSFNTMASSTMAVVAGIAAFTGAKAPSLHAPTSLLQKLTTGVRLATMVWLLFRGRSPASDKKQLRGPTP